jgi:Mycotoxin biosynthesis protein UstYa
MALSILGGNGNGKTSSYRLANRGSNDGRESSSDVDEVPASTKPSPWSNLVSLRLALVLLLLSFLFNIVHLYRSHSSKPRPQFVPNISYTSTPVVFSQDARWVGASPAVEAQWDQHVNNAVLGYIQIPNPSAYHLKHGVNYGLNNTEIFSISMYHQLHCLAMIRHAYYHPLDAHMHHGGRSDASQRTVHLDHCFDYLRQAITCAADMTVEWAKVEYDGTRRQVDGWGIPHWQCRDPEGVEAFMREHRIA